MNLNFSKYQGTGNDFIIIDNRDKSVVLTEDQIAHICDRRFGVGADGLMLLEESDTSDFRMVYFNSDGRESTMCGNGGRCISAYAQKLGVFELEAEFEAIDGLHWVKVVNSSIELGMSDVAEIEKIGADYFLDTGSPHYVKFSTDVLLDDVRLEGSKIRNSERFRKEGTNVNFIEFDDGRLIVRTYERGVEDETLSCGTGVTAGAICFSLENNKMDTVPVSTIGGMLNVKLNWDKDSVKNISLIGPAEFVFEGIIEV